MTIVMRMLPALPLASLLLAGAAHAETRASARVGVEGGYGSNPFLDANSGSSGSLVSRIEPVVTVLGPTTQLDVNGRLEHILFTNGYDDMTNWSLGSSLGVTLSPRSQFSVSGGYSSQVQSAISSVLPIPGEEGLPPIDPSGAELGGSRIENLNGNASFSSQLSGRTSVNASVFVSDINYDSVVFQGYSYTSYGSSIGVSHSVSSRTSVGVSVSYSKSNYDLASYGDFQQISPSANVSIKLSPQLTLKASAGISFSQSKLLTGTTNQRHFSGSADLCYTGLRDNWCVTASRSLGSTARAGSSTITAFGVNYGYKLTPRSGINVSGQYSESKSVDPFFGNVSYGYGIASASYNQELGRRLSFSVSARYTEPFKSISGSRRGFYGGAGINYRLGR